MRLRHMPAGEDVDDGPVLATRIEVADSLRTQLRGLMLRDVPDDFALVFEFGRVGYRSIHMLLVREPLDVVWLRGSAVTKRATLAPWTGLGLARADRVVELPAGAAERVEPGDELLLEGR